MENIQSYAPFIWKFYQLNFIENKQKYSQLLRFMGFGFLIANSFAFNCICVAEFFMFPATMEHALVLVVILSLNTRYLINYLFLFLNFEKVRKAAVKLPGSYDQKIAEKYAVIKRLRRSRIPSIASCISLIISFTGTIATSGLSKYVHEIISTDRMFHSNRKVEKLVEIWIILDVLATASFRLVYAAVLYGMIILLTVEFGVVCDKIEEIKIKIENSQNTATNISKITKINPKSTAILEEKTLKTEIVKIIEKHAQLLDIRNDLEDVFAPTFLVNMFCGLVTVCFEEIVIISTENSNMSRPLIVSVVSQLLMIFIQCYYCQQLKDASDNVANAVYDIKWEEIENVNLKKHFLMILIRSQKSKSLTCWKFAENSYELFGSVRKVGLFDNVLCKNVKQLQQFITMCT